MSRAALNSRRPLPVAPRPFFQEVFGAWIGRIASCYRLTVREFAQQMRLDLEGLLGGAGWLLLPAQSARTLECLADLVRMEPAELRAIEIPRAWSHRRSHYLYCSRCVFLNPEDVASPYWKRSWIDPAVEICEVHASPLHAIPSSRVRTSLNLSRLLAQVGRYEREPKGDKHDPILR